MIWRLSIALVERIGNCFWEHESYCLKDITCIRSIQSPLLFLRLNSSGFVIILHLRRCNICRETVLWHLLKHCILQANLPLSSFPVGCFVHSTNNWYFIERYSLSDADKQANRISTSFYILGFSAYFSLWQGISPDFVIFENSNLQVLNISACHVFL